MSGRSLSDDGRTPAEALTVGVLFDQPDAEPDVTTEEGWLALRRRALKPRVVSDLVSTEEDRREFLRGAEMLRFHGPRAMRGRAVVPQQLLVVDMLAAGHQKNAALLPRRSSKSTSVIAVGLGRAEAREDYRVGILTMTTGKAGRSRFLKDVVPAIERSGTPLGTYKVVRAAGQERVEFDASGGSVSWLSTVDDLRGEAFDMIVLDEAGEAEPQKVEDALAAALPTLDTRPGAQIVVAGTAGKYRRGNLLWEWLELLRASEAGGVEYAMPETLTEEDVDTWEAIRPHVLASHPGIGTLTTEEAIRGNYLTLPRETFLREYGGIFGDEGGTVSLFDPIKWARTGIDGALPAPGSADFPERFSLAVAPHPDQLCTSIVAAWRDEKGRAVLLQLEALQGIDAAAPALLRYARRFKVPVVYDAGSQVAQLIVEKLTRPSSGARPKLHPYVYADVKRAASLIVDEADRENIVHWRDQLVLTEGVHRTVKRKSGDRGWLLGRDPKRPDDDITPVEAAALALLHYDGSKPKAKPRGRMATT